MLLIIFKQLDETYTKIRKKLRVLSGTILVTGTLMKSIKDLEYFQELVAGGDYIKILHLKQVNHILYLYGLKETEMLIYDDTLMVMGIGLIKAVLSQSRRHQQNGLEYMLYLNVMIQPSLHLDLKMVQKEQLLNSMDLNQRKVIKRQIGLLLLKIPKSNQMHILLK